MATKTKQSFGSCYFSHISPAQGALSPDTRTLNVIVSFDDALKLSLALDECVRKINSYNRATKAGKNAAVNLTVHLLAGRIAVNEGKL